MLLLLSMYVLLSFPFFPVATFIVITFSCSEKRRRAQRIDQSYYEAEAPNSSDKVETHGCQESCSWENRLDYLWRTKPHEERRNLYSPTRLEDGNESRNQGLFPTVLSSVC